MTYFQNKEKFFAFLGVLLVFLFLLEGCTRQQRPPLGSEKNPIKFILLPSADVRVLASTAAFIKRYLEAETPYKYRFSVPTSYIAVVEALGAKRADVATLNAPGYILANNRFKTEARLIVQRHGSINYQSQIIARADGPIKSLADIKGRKFAYVDPMSMSGYLMPEKLLTDKKIKPQETIFAQRHDNVVTMVYNGQVDAGATWHSPPHNGKMQDARLLVQTQYTDIEKKVKIVHLTEPFPNDPIVFRAGMPQKLKEDTINALLSYMSTKEGKKIFHELVRANGLVRCSDSTYDSVRKMLKTLNKSAEDLI